MHSKDLFVMERYTKPALKYEDQIALIKSRGLIIDDEARTKRHLSNVSYYRISAYMLPFKKRDSNGNALDQFIEGTTWDNIYDLYKFDRKLRLLVFDAIERIEIAVRTQVIYQLSHKYGSHWQTKKKIFKPIYKDSNTGRSVDVYNEIKKHISAELKKNNTIFIQHYKAKYDNPSTPPSWMSIELLYFSELSKICQGLKERSDRTDIAKAFGIVDESIFCSWLHTINYIRNICAHHARLWNIKVDVVPKKYYNKTNNIWLTNEEVNCAKSTKLYYTLCVILYMLQTVNPKTKFKQHFYELLEKYHIVNPSIMGFPENWKEMPIWKK